MEKTFDPEVVIESREGESIVYLNITNGKKWKVTGVCDRRGHCMVGAVIDGILVESVEHLNQLCEDKGKERLDSELDVPVGINFRNCCPFVIEEL